VIKAVLINSADKIQDQGNGKNLEMSKTILDPFGKTWLDSEAYTNQNIPLSLYIGAGQLNAYRAFQQYQAGSQSPINGIANIKAIGWDSNFVTQNQYQDYNFAAPLSADSFIAATLTWDRQVKLNDTNNNGIYDIGEDFKNEGFNKISLHLMRSQDNDINQSVWSSISQVDNLQHIFIKIPATGKYKLRVLSKSSEANSPSQRYAIAWWTKI
jgi:hypothetical protein